MKDFFDSVAKHTTGQAHAGEVILCWFAAEVSDFIRFNKARVRQAMTIRQINFTVTLIRGQRKLARSLMLAGNEADFALIDETLHDLRGNVADVPEDPFLLYATSVTNTQFERRGALPSADAVVNDVASHAGASDFVGLYAGGPVYRGFANSLGQRNWHAVDSFNFEWCLYHDKDKAIKTGYAGNDWQSGAFAAKVAEAQSRMPQLAQPAKTLGPGEYRAYLTPTAVSEVLRTLCWEGFSEKAVRTRQSALGALYDGSQSLASQFSLTEDTANGIAAGFQAEGFVKPDNVPLISAGRGATALTGPRTAKEYGVANNADGDESPVSLSLAAGSLAEADALAALDTGVWVSNLWYLNYSDRQACRLTGMTRFACFWVEKGKLVAPINVMRFDDTAYRLFGSGLEALGATPEMIAEGDTYQQRGATSTRTPGALVRDFKFTL
jgi:predicted Zn-dependent protease